MFIHMNKDMLLYCYSAQVSDLLTNMGIPTFLMVTGQTNRCVLIPGDSFPKENRRFIQVLKKNDRMMAIIKASDSELPTLIGKFIYTAVEQYFLEWRLKHTKEAAQ